MAIYPNNTPSDSDLYVALDNFGAALNGAIDASQTTITLTNTVGLPTVGILTIDSEKVKYTGVSGNDVTGCTRGFSATTAAAHANASGVWFNVVEEHHNVLKDEIIALATDNRATFTADLDDSVTPTATATSLKQRLDMIVERLKAIMGAADWKDAISNTLSSLASSISGLTSSKKSIATGNAYKFETTGATGDLQETTVTPSRAVATDANGLPVASTTTDTELGYVNGVTSAIQTQLNGKEPTLTKGNLTESTSSVLTITGGTGAVIGSGTTIQVASAASGVAGVVTAGTQTITGAKTFETQLIGKGTATNDSAPSGYIGEVIESVVSTGTSTGASGAFFDATSVSLTAGHWVISAELDWSRNSATFTSFHTTIGVSTTSGNSSSGLTLGSTRSDDDYGTALTTQWSNHGQHLSDIDVKLSSTTTYYLKGQVEVYTTGTPQYRCRLTARRVR